MQHKSRTRFASSWKRRGKSRSLGSSSGQTTSGRGLWISLSRSQHQVMISLSSISTVQLIISNARTFFSMNIVFFCRLNSLPSITALKFHGGLTLGVGTATGQVLLYDIRSNKPFIVKDHMYELPIKNVEFHKTMDLVYSMDSAIVKIWEKQTVWILEKTQSCVFLLHIRRYLCSRHYSMLNSQRFRQRTGLIGRILERNLKLKKKKNYIQKLKKRIFI